MIYISIILSAYNDEKTVLASIESVMAQENVDLQMECIVVDDCSTDNTLAIIRRKVGSYHGNIKFRLYRHQTHHGLARTRNTGQRQAQGLYVLFLNAKDKLRQGCIDTFMVNLMRHWDVDMIAGNEHNVSLMRNLFSNLSGDKELRGKGDQLKHEMLRNHLYLYANNKLIKRDLLTMNQIEFDENLAYPDIIWAFSLFSCMSSIVLLPDVVYDYGKREALPISQTEKWVNTLLASYTATCETLLDNSPRPESSDNGYYHSHQLFVYGILNSAMNMQKEYNINSQVQREISSMRNRLFNQTKNDGQKKLYLFFKQDDSIFSGLFSNPGFTNYSRMAKEVTTMLDVMVGR